MHAPGWREPRLRGRCELVDHEQETTRLTGVETLDRVRGGLAALHDDGAECLAERGRHRRFGTGLDLEEVDQRTDDPGDTGELLAPGRGAGGVESEVERVGTGAPARRFRLGGAPRFVGRAQDGFGAGDVAGVGGRRRGDRVVELGELAAQHTGVGHERLEHAGIGRRRELAFDAAIASRRPARRGRAPVHESTPPAPASRRARRRPSP